MTWGSLAHHPRTSEWPENCTLLSPFCNKWIWGWTSSSTEKEFFFLCEQDFRWKTFFLPGKKSKWTTLSLGNICVGGTVESKTEIVSGTRKWSVLQNSAQKVIREDGEADCFCSLCLMSQWQCAWVSLLCPQMKFWRQSANSWVEFERWLTSVGGLWRWSAWSQGPRMN